MLKRFIVNLYRNINQNGGITENNLNQITMLTHLLTHLACLLEHQKNFQDSISARTSVLVLRERMFRLKPNEGMRVFLVSAMENLEDARLRLLGDANPTFVRDATEHLRVLSERSASIRREPTEPSVIMNNEPSQINIGPRQNTDSIESALLQIEWEKSNGSRRTPTQRIDTVTNALNMIRRVYKDENRPPDRLVAEACFDAGRVYEQVNRRNNAIALQKESLTISQRECSNVAGFPLALSFLNYGSVVEAMGSRRDAPDVFRSIGTENALRILMWKGYGAYQDLTRYMGLFFISNQLDPRIFNNLTKTFSFAFDKNFTHFAAHALTEVPPTGTPPDLSNNSKKINREQYKQEMLHWHRYREKTVERLRSYACLEHTNKTISKAWSHLHKVRASMNEEELVATLFGKDPSDNTHALLTSGLRPINQSSETDMSLIGNTSVHVATFTLQAACVMSIMGFKTTSADMAEQAVVILRRANDPSKLAAGLTDAATCLTRAKRLAIARDYSNEARTLRAVKPVATGTVAVAAAAPANTTSRDANNTVIRQITDKVAVLSRGENAEPIVRHSIPRTERAKANRMIEYTHLASRHPNSLMSLLAVKHQNDIIDVDVEYADAQTLRQSIPLIGVSERRPEAEKIAIRTAFARAVVRQVLSGLLYFNVMHERAHGSITPRYIFLTQKGSVKTDLYDLFDPDTITHNWQSYFSTLPYVAPERRVSESTFAGIGVSLERKSQGDVYALGALIYAIMTGKTLEPKNGPVRPKIAKDDADNNISRGRGPRQQEPARPQPRQFDYSDVNYIAERAEFERFMANSADEAQWERLIPNDPWLRELTKRCLVQDPVRRISLEDAHAFTYWAGGITENASNWICDGCPPKALPFAGVSPPTQPAAGSGAVASRQQPSAETRAPLSAEARADIISHFPTNRLHRTIITARSNDARQKMEIAAVNDRIKNVTGGNDAWEMDTTSFDTPTEVNNVAGAPLLRCMKRLGSPGLDGYATNPDVTARMRNFCKAFNDEFIGWREARNTPGKRSAVELLMREVLTRRNVTAWTVIKALLPESVKLNPAHSQTSNVAGGGAASSSSGNINPPATAHTAPRNSLFAEVPPAQNGANTPPPAHARP